MKILTIRTDKPEAEVGLYDDQNQLVYKVWQAHRELSVTLHTAVEELLEVSTLAWSDIEGVVFYGGPGSFTGLRIGAAFANALAAGNNLPLVQSSSERWLEDGIERLLDGESMPALPEYGAEAHTTAPKK